jgi:hypothetical protein
MTNPEQIVGYLQKNKPRAFCDDCLAGELQFARRQEAAVITATLGLTSDYVRQRGACSICKNDKLKYVIHAVVTKAAATRS